MADLMDRQPLVLGAVASASAPQWPPRLPSTADQMHLLSEASADLQARTRESVPPRGTRVPARRECIGWSRLPYRQIKLSDLDRRISLAAHGLRWAARGQADSVTRTRPRHFSRAVESKIRRRKSALSPGGARLWLEHAPAAAPVSVQEMESQPPRASPGRARFRRLHRGVPGALRESR